MIGSEGSPSLDSWPVRHCELSLENSGFLRSRNRRLTWLIPLHSIHVLCKVFGLGTLGAIVVDPSDIVENHVLFAREDLRVAQVAVFDLRKGANGASPLLQACDSWRELWTHTPCGVAVLLDVSTRGGGASRLRGKHPLRMVRLGSFGGIGHRPMR